MAKTKQKTALIEAEEAYQVAQLKAAKSLLEALPTFARDDDEDKWVTLQNNTEVYTEAQLTAMHSQAKLLYYKDPCARGIIETMVNFVIGKNASVKSKDEAPEVQDYWNKWAKLNKFDKRSKEIIRRAFRDGEVFLRWFKEGKQLSEIRFINPEEIKDISNTHTYGIETDPDDIEKVISYRRSYMVGTEQRSETIPAEEMIHIKIMCDSDMKRGISFLIGIAGYIKKYSSWLEDRIYLNKIRHYFNLVAKPTGTSSTNDVAGLFNDVTSSTPRGGVANKKQPKPGTLLAYKGLDFEYKTLNINAGDTKDDGRAIELMIAKGTQLTEYIIRGDASNANYASSMVSESPMVRMFESWQDEFEKIFMEMHERVVSEGLADGELPATSTQTVKDIDKKTGETWTKTETISTSIECTVNFATLIHRDPQAETTALTLQKSNGWLSDKTAMASLGLDYDEEIEQIAKEMAVQGKTAKENYNNEKGKEEDGNTKDGSGDENGKPEAKTS